MKNIFDFATKELTQDAFLIWLFENYTDPTLEKLSLGLINEFCALKQGEIIENLKTKAQDHKIDIYVSISTNKREIALFIEDKTFSNEHNQLSTYNNYIDKLDKDKEIFKIYYKTNIIDDNEKTKIDSANSYTNIKWKIYDINKIIPIFEKYISTNNVIVTQYIDYIKRINDALKNKNLPTEQNSHFDLLKWKAFFIHIKKNLSNKNYYRCEIDTWRNKYVYIRFFDKHQDNIPHLEIRSRDCLNNQFQARILCHGVSYDDYHKNETTLFDIKNRSEFSTTKLRKNKNGKPTLPKLVGITEKIQISNEKNFTSKLEEYLKIYSNIMKNWQ